MKAVIMAGGKGTRLGVISQDIPKPMIEINGKPLLQYQIENLKKYEISEIILIVGHLGDKIINYFGSGEFLGVTIRYIVEETPLGTGGALFYLKEEIKEDFILIFGDILFDIDLRKFIDFHKLNNGAGTLLLHPNSHPYDSDLVVMNKESKVIEIDSKNKKRNYYYRNCVNSGIYIFKTEIFKYIEKAEKKCLEKDIILPMLENKENIYGYKTVEYVKDMGTPDRFDKIKGHVESGVVENKNLSKKQSCIFIDRDGTINKYKGLIYKAEDLELEDGVIEALREINDSKFISIVITNQPVIARNLCSIEQLENIHKKLETLLGNEGVYLDDIHYCPHHPDSGYEGENKLFKIECNCRKPKTGLIDYCAEKYNIDLNESYFIGDSTVDVMTGKNAGLKTVLLKTGVKGTDGKYIVEPDFICSNLKEAITLILKGMR